MKGLVLTAAAVLLLAGAAAAEPGPKALAKRLARAAEKAGIERVAVLPFSPLDESGPAHGRLLAEELTEHLARRGTPRLVERAMLPAVLGEHRLGASGALAPESLLRLGRMLQAQAVVVGSYVTLGGTVELNARLIELETGVVLASGRARAKGKAFAGFGVIPRPEPISPVESIAQVLAAQKGYDYAPGRAAAPEEFRDALVSREAAQTPESCVAAEERVNALLRGILGLKARYWARQAGKRGAPPGLLEVPARQIPDPELRAEFYALVARAAERKAPPLDPVELKRFIAADREAMLLRLRCLAPAAGSAR